MSPKRILIVEDERIVAEDLMMVLSGMGYTVIGIAGTADTAIRSAREHLPDLIMMDISLAGTRDGIEAAETIRTFHDVPVIFLTAFSDEKIIERAKTALPYGYLLKPFRERELKIAIEIALYSHELNRKLKESEERYRGFVTHFIGIAYRRRMDFSPVFFHGSIENITGYTEEEILQGRPGWEDLIAPADSGRIRAQNLKILEQETYQGTRDYCITRKDGEIRWVHELLQKVPGKGGMPQYIQGSIYDITDRKKAEEAQKKMNFELEERVRQRTLTLNQQLLFLQQLIDTIPSPVFYKDAQNTYVGCNVAFERYIGTSRSGIVGRTDEDILPEEFAILNREKDQYLLTHSGIQVYQAKFPHVDHTVRDVLVRKATYNGGDGKVAGFIGVLVDLTDRIQAEEQLREREMQFRAMLDDLTDLVYRFTPKGTVLYANNAFLSFFNKSAEDITGYTFRLPVHPEDQAALDAFFASLSPSHPIDRIAIRCMREGGEARWIEWINRAFFDEHSNVSGYLSVGRDITDRKNM